MTSASDDTKQGVQQLLGIMERLRDPQEGCPWDIEQTFETIAPYTIEEAYEVADAIHRSNKNDLREELGDLLFQVVYHARLAEEEGWFNFSDVAASISEKLVRRHPHVFGDEKIANASDQSHAWEQHKEQERNMKSSGGMSQMDGVPLSLPALTRAEKLQKRAARVGFDWPDLRGVLDKVDEEVAEVLEAVRQQDPQSISEEIGDLLFTCANLARYCNLDPETVLRGANHKFEKRFRYMETQFISKNKSLKQADPGDLDQAWEEAKKHAE